MNCHPNFGLVADAVGNNCTIAESHAIAVKHPEFPRIPAKKLTVSVTAISFSQAKEVDLVDLDDALQDLAKLDARQSKIVELRFFAGLTIEETAHALGISTMTVSREWNFAKAWLYRRLNNE